MPEGLEREFQEDLQRFEQERQMQYIEALSLTQLEDLGEALLEFSRREDLEDWLWTHSPE